ncbi:MAG: integrase [Verrucomicrobia bacterium]|nr:integrase [Verrucomicrobiota bacterium]
MKPRRSTLRAYLALRRSLGYKLRDAARYLELFLAFLAQRQAPRITAALALEFATADPRLGESSRAARFAAVRAFAQYWHGCDPHSEVPPAGLVRKTARRATPWSCAEAPLAALLQSFRDVPPSPVRGLRPWTLEALIGLLAVSGLRISEAIALQQRDLDWTHGTLTVRHTKFGKSRWVVLHRSTLRVLAAYAERRTRFFARAAQRPQENFFLSNHGTALFATSVRKTFRQHCRAAGLLKLDGRPPRLHDLRHRFAVETLRRWYRAGGPVEPRLPALATYLGHRSVAATYWYLSGTPALRAAASKRVEAHWKGVGDDHQR